jgi:hypothetical protein
MTRWQRRARVRNETRRKCGTDAADVWLRIIVAIGKGTQPTEASQDYSFDKCIHEEIGIFSFLFSILMSLLVAVLSQSKEN